jgi:dipeptidase D
VAAIMALLASKDLAHPALEAFFTIDEETGMTGAKQMDGSLLQGKILLNLDTEDDDELSIGCAGGIDTNTSYKYQETTIHSGWEVVKIKLRGLLGGHSGMDIDKGRGNANKWMARILWELHRENPMQLISFDGGSLRNAIPREATCRIAVSDSESAIQKLENSIAQLKEEYLNLEPEHRFEIETVVSSGDALNDEDCTKILNALCSVHNGVFRMSPDIPQLVEASTSLARVVIQDGLFTTQSLQRSSVESTKAEVSMTVRAAFENMGATVEQAGDYPGWQPNRNSSILKVMENLYTGMFHEAPHVKACHAGLECGILGKHLPGVEMISFGPNIRAAHSPDEKVQISSVQKFWSFLLETLKNIPNKA